MPFSTAILTAGWLVDTDRRIGFDWQFPAVACLWVLMTHKPVFMLQGPAWLCAGPTQNFAAHM